MTDRPILANAFKPYSAPLTRAQPVLDESQYLDCQPSTIFLGTFGLEAHDFPCRPSLNRWRSPASLNVPGLGTRRSGTGLAV